MIFHPAAYALLLLSSRDLRPVRGDPSKSTAARPSSLQFNPRRLKKGDKDSGKDAASVNDSIDLNDYPCTLRNKKDQCDTADEECVWIDKQCVDNPPPCSVFGKEKSCEKNNFRSDCVWESGECGEPQDQIDSSSTMWPTYSPTLEIVTPSITTNAIPTFDVHALLDCAPIGTRTSFPLQPRNNPIASSSPSAPPTSSPVPKIDLDEPTNDKPVDLDGPTGDNGDVTFRRGDLRKDIARFGIKVSKGMIVREVARANVNVKFADGGRSELGFHSSPDGAAVIKLEKGYVYVSNSEVVSGKGGVYGIYFDDNGNVMDYKMLLKGTTRNCSGGTTPWGTFVSCEEYGRGQCFQIDPNPLGEHHSRPEQTNLGGDGGNFEAVGCDDRNPSQPIFFLTEDHKSGTLRKYTPPPTLSGTPAGWDALHVDGFNMEYLVFLDDERFTWTCDEQIGRFSQERYFPNVEGISYHNGLLYFVSKVTYKLYVLDLDNGTYKTSTTSDYSLYDGEFKHGPDQLVQNEGGQFLYFTEDGGNTAGVYAIDSEGQSYSIFEAYSDKYFGDETTGLAFSPDGTKMYACFQDCGCETSGDIDCGCMFEFWRDDGRSFDGATMSLKYHSSEQQVKV